MSWRWGVDWVCGISSLILKRQPSAGWNKEGGMIGLCGRHRASLKSICVPVSDHKRQALQESSSLSVCVCVCVWGGGSLLSSLSLHDSSLCVPPCPRSCPKTQPRFLFHLTVFHIFPLFSGGFVSTPLPALSLFSLHPAHPLPGFPRVYMANLRTCLIIKEALLLPPTNEPVHVSMFVWQLSGSQNAQLHREGCGLTQVWKKRREMRGSRKKIMAKEGEWKTSIIATVTTFLVMHAV